MTEPSTAPEGEALPDDIGMEADRLIAECGSARQAVILLVEANRRLELDLALTRPAVSRGFSRGWHHRAWEHA